MVLRRKLFTSFVLLCISACATTSSQHHKSDASSSSISIEFSETPDGTNSQAAELALSRFDEDVSIFSSNEEIFIQQGKLYAVELVLRNWPNVERNFQGVRPYLLYDVKDSNGQIIRMEQALSPVQQLRIHRQGNVARVQFSVRVQEQDQTPPRQDLARIDAEHGLMFVFNSMADNTHSDFLHVVISLSVKK